MKKTQQTVIHLTEGSRWAGIETHLKNLIPPLSRCKNLNVIFASFDQGQITESLKSNNLQTRVLGRRRKFDLAVIVKLLRLLKSNNTDILHMHGYLSIIYGIPAALLAKVPVLVVTLHAKPFPEGNGIQQYKFRLLLNIAYSLVKWSNTQLIAVSGDIAKSCKEVRELRNCEIRVIHNAIDIEGTRSNAKHKEIDNHGSDKPIVGIVGRIDKNKGHIYFIEAAERLASQGVVAKYWVIGSGPLEDTLKKHCSNNNVGSHVEFLGFKKDILRYMAQLDVLVIPSFHEGIPYTMLEAMAIGVPVIATGVGGMPEVIEDSVNGFLVSVQCPDEIALRVRQILSDPQLKQRISEAALHNLCDKFSDVAMVQAVNDAYCEYLSIAET